MLINLFCQEQGHSQNHPRDDNLESVSKPTILPLKAHVFPKLPWRNGNMLADIYKLLELKEK